MQYVLLLILYTYNTVQKQKVLIQEQTFYHER